MTRPSFLKTWKAYFRKDRGLQAIMHREKAGHFKVNGLCNRNKEKRVVPWGS